MKTEVSRFNETSGRLLARKGQSLFLVGRKADQSLALKKNLKPNNIGGWILFDDDRQYRLTR